VHYVTVKLLVPLPARALLKGEWWVLEYITEGKNGKIGTLLATCDTDQRQYILTTGRESVALHQALNGFTVKRGTPEHGLVSALRRAGLVRIEAEDEDPAFYYG
jgi:hypothetical protein